MKKTKNVWVSLNYQETPESKKWLDNNTGKIGMSDFIRSAVAEKIKREKELKNK